MLKVTKKQDFNSSLENTALEKPQEECQIDLPPTNLLRVNSDLNVVTAK